MNFENLTKLPIEELRTLAAKHGVKAHHKAKSEKIAHDIIEAVTAPKQELKHPAQKLVQATIINTEEQVRETCKPFFSKEGFQATLTPETWYFAYRGAEDTGHMSVPLRIIRMKAESVSRGARKPIMFEDGPEVGKKILAVG